MTVFLWILGLVLAALGATISMKVHKWGPFLPKNDPKMPDLPQNSPVRPVQLPNDPSISSKPNPTSPMPNIAPTAPVTPDPDSFMYPWDTQKHYYHNVRVLCDKADLTLEQKNDVCACIYQESRFRDFHDDGTPVSNPNKDPKTGEVWSTDWGLVQVNDWFHIQPHGEPFPSVDYVVHNPAATAGWMISIMKDTGALQPWSSWTSGAYRQWLAPNSPMWALVA